MLSLSVSLIWLLALLAASAHIRQGTMGLRTVLAMALVFALVLALALRLAPQPNWIGVLVGLSAMWSLIGGPLPRAGAMLGAACAALAAALQVAAGLTVWIAAPLAALALVAALLLLGRPVARTGLRDVVLVVTALGAPAIGLAGDLVYGWHSAAVLNRGAVAQHDIATPAWAVVIVALALLAGALRGLWKHR